MVSTVKQLTLVSDYDMACSSTSSIRHVQLIARPDIAESIDYRTPKDRIKLERTIRLIPRTGIRRIDEGPESLPNFRCHDTQPVRLSNLSYTIKRGKYYVVVCRRAPHCFHLLQ